MKKLFCTACLVSMFALTALLLGCSTAPSSAGSSSAAASSVASSAAAEASVSSSAVSTSTQAQVEDGEYLVPVSTDSSMFHLNDSSEGMGTLTVKDGAMSVHISLNSKKITNLYSGTAAQAKEDEAGWLQPTTDTVTYSDGTTEEVYGFDIPVPALDEPFGVSILGSKGKWYDHTVTVSSPVAK